MEFASFPNQGEVIKFVFDAFGVLPRKFEKNTAFGETTKKTTQTALARLVKEKGSLNENSEELNLKFQELIEKILPRREFLAFGAVLQDLFETYRVAISNEGTYLCKSKTIKYLLEDRLSQRLAISITKHIQRYNVQVDGQKFPSDTFWYLPKKVEQKWHWPLENVMRWAYKDTGTSIQSFHLADETREDLQKNLSSAKNWLSGRTLPSWTSLLTNFNQSFAEIDAKRIDSGQEPLSERKKTDIRTALFLARGATYISQKICEAYGDVFLEEIIHRVKCTKEYASDIKNLISERVYKEAVNHSIPMDKWDEIWYHTTMYTWKEYADKICSVIKCYDAEEISLQKALELVRPFGQLAVQHFTHPEQFEPTHKDPDGFWEMYYLGLDLKKSTDLTLEKIDAFDDQIKKSGLASVISWMPNWLRSIYSYRANNYADAFIWIKKANRFAQYCAGKHQYEIVNMHIELCAKNEKWKEFSQAIRWANFIGLQVRWLREHPQTESNLRSLFKLMKTARYIV